MAAPIIIVGAGVAGLVAAVELALAGAKVALYEASDVLGGKMHQVKVGAKHLDMGPSVLTLRHVFDELFARAGACLDDAVTLRAQPLIARHMWTDGASLDLGMDVEQNTDAIGQCFGAQAAQGYRNFAAHSHKLWELAKETFVYRTKPTLAGAAWHFGRRVLTAPRDMDAFRTLDQALLDFFPQTLPLRQLFGRYATYSGASPLQAPATLALIAHVERLGVWHIEGGLSALAAALAALATRLGVVMHTGHPVRGALADGRRALGIELMDGTQVAGRAVIFNGDIRIGHTGVWWPNESTCSGGVCHGLSHIAWGLVADTDEAPLALHNIFFPAQGSVSEFHAIFNQHSLPTDPTVYVCAADRGQTSDVAAQKEERLFCLTNAPPMRVPLTPAQLAQRQTLMLKTLAKCGVNVQLRHEARVMQPTDFAQRFPGTDGAIYGMPPHGWRSFFTRPGARAQIKHLYRAGGSVHPGPGVPMAALSGKMAAQAALSDLA